MWQLESLQIKKVKSSFLASEQLEVTQLWSQNIELVNAVEYVNWGDSELQFIVCDSCGYVGCAAGNWVEIKRTESLALIMPAFTKLREAAQTMQREYLPPDYLLERGVIYIDKESYQSSFCQIAPLPNFDTLSPLSAWEAVKVFQLEAPYLVLGNILHPPKLYKDITIASSAGNFMEQTSELISLIDNLSNSSKANDAIDLRKITASDQIISLYLDISGCPEWSALSYDGSIYSLYLYPGYIIN